jgi:mannose-6-phosphate isomerase-like protein (cupin superfamily)
LSAGKYEIHLDDKFGYSTLIDADAEANACTVPWFNQTLTTVNDALVRLGVFHGEFHWHKHDEQDEFFFVLEGELLLDIDHKETHKLKQHQGYTVPKGIMHRTRAPERTVVLMIEQRGVIPRGD